MTQNTTNALLALGVVAVIAVGAFLLGHNTAPQAAKLGGSAYEALPKWFGNGLSAGSSQQLAIDGSGVITSDATISGGTINVTTANAATSTVIAGCVQG